MHQAVSKTNDGLVHSVEKGGYHEVERWPACINYYVHITQGGGGGGGGLWKNHTIVSYSY
jgi:hypothetical protein